MATGPQHRTVDETLAIVEGLLASAPAPHVSDRFDASVIRWMCLVPVWTPTLAARCRMPGWSSPNDTHVLDTWRTEGLIESMHTPLAIDDAGQVTPAQHLFWVPRNARAAWVSRVIAEDGRDRLFATVWDISRRILAQPNDQYMPHATWRWAVVASHATAAPSTLHDAFERELDSALEHGRPDEAWVWIEALQRVAEVVPGETTTLHQRAVRRLALFDRQRNDRAMLRDYLPRLSLFEDYRDVVTGPDAVWGLHYLGGGGVGKTMLMRALTSGTAEHLPPGFTLPATVTARIDFDHINPDYPARRPGLLFAHLAEELRLKDDSLRASEGFGLLFSKIALLHERAGGDATPAGDIDEILYVFAWACAAIASSREARVVLLLDTCEELARLGPDGSLPGSVERTFELLERLHGKLPSLRVVFCGRRPLAGTYAGGEDVSTRLPERPWLRLHRVSAFSESEARSYLQRTGVPDGLVAPILERSAAAASSAAIGQPPDVEPRYSPFSLSVYSTWIARQPDVVPEAIAGDRVDHFVRIRILDRIHNGEVSRLLPHVALLGRFDDATLRACVDVRPDVADAVLREIGSQEWIDRQAGGYYAVEPELRARLLRYFEREESRALAEARQRILPALWKLLNEGSETQLPDEAVVQALVQMIHTDREALLAAWRVLDARIVQGVQASWGARVLGRLLADEASLASGRVDAGAWGALVTTFAECVLHEQGAVFTTELWQKAWDSAQSLAEPHERASVLVRIASGALTNAATTPDAASAFDTWALRLYNLVSDRVVSVTAPLSDVPTDHRRKPVYAAIAALMACADAAERRPDPLEPAQPLLERIASVVVEVRHAPARAIALTCIGRLAARRQDADLAHKRFVDALRTLTDSADRDVLPCLQWPANLDATSWVTLEAMRGLSGLEPVEETLERFSNVPLPRREIALNRLGSLRLRLMAAVHVPEEPSLPPGTRVSGIGPGDVSVPETLAHEVIRPRAVSLALEHVEGGRPAEGLRLLGELTSVATSARNTAVATAVERARIEAVTRMRLGEHGRLNRQIVAGSASLPLEERERMRAFLPDGVTVVLDEGTVTTRWEAHCVWRAKRAVGHREQERLGEAGRRLLTLRDRDGQGEWARASVALDLVECSELGADVDLAAQGLTPVSPEDWWSRHPALPEFALRLWIRSAALGVSPGGPTSILVRRVGVRRAAAIAMEEGELLALRLPTQALRLLALSLTWYEDAHDALGVWQVTTLLALTRVRAGVPRDGIDLTALQAAHEPLVGTGADRGVRGLPPWSWIEKVGQLPLPDTAATSEWAPWLHRVIALHHWVRGGVRPEVLFTTVEWLPVELREWPIDAIGGDAVSTSETRLAAAPGPGESETPTVAMPVPPSRPVGVPAPAPAPPPSIAPTPPVLRPGRAASAPRDPGPATRVQPKPESSTVPVAMDAASPRAAAPAQPWLLLIGVAALLVALLLAAWLFTRIAGRSSGPEPNEAPSAQPDSREPKSSSRPDQPSLPPGAGPTSKEPEPNQAAKEPPSSTVPRPDEPGGAAGPSVVLPPPEPGPVAVPEAPPSSPVIPIAAALAAMTLFGVGAWLLLRRRAPAAPAALPQPPAPWVAQVIATGTDPATGGRVAALDVQVTMADARGEPIVNVPLRVRRTDAFSGLDALRQPPTGTALSAPYATKAAPERAWLEVSLATAWPCWEALLWSGQVEGTQLRPAVVRHVRSSRPARRASATSAPWSVATVAATAGDERQAAYAWEPSLRAGRVALTPVMAEAVREGVPLGGVRLVHVTAQPIETPQGLYFEVAGGETMVVKESLQSLANDRGTLFDASQIVHAFPEATCLLLQPPRRPALDITPAGRETCASLRIIGAALAEQGIPLVIVMPPFDGELAAHVVRLVGRRVPRLRAGAPIDPHEFTTRVREVVFGHAQRLLPRDAAIELALQVTVYAL